jgi:hypothetical protein
MNYSRRAATGSLVIGLLLCMSPAFPQPLPEYELKAAFLYNFVLFTEWPGDTGGSLNLCVYGTDPFGDALDALQGKPVSERRLEVRRTAAGESLAGCQIVFISRSAISGLGVVLEELRGGTTLTVADSPGATVRGVALNMSVSQNKVAFEANLRAARRAGLNLSSKLLRLATEVIQ